MVIVGFYPINFARESSNPFRVPTHPHSNAGVTNLLGAKVILALHIKAKLLRLKEKSLPGMGFRIKILFTDMLLNELVLFNIGAHNLQRTLEAHIQCHKRVLSLFYIHN